jgi:hypothetical protein
MYMYVFAYLPTCLNVLFGSDTQGAQGLRALLLTHDVLPRSSLTQLG